MTADEVQKAAEALTPGQWRDAMTCGDHLDSFPCSRCRALGPGGCKSRLSTSETRAVVDFVNGFGWSEAFRRFGHDR